MTDTCESDTAATAESFRLRLITTDAEKAFAELIPEHQKKVLKALSGRVRAIRTKKWKGRNPTGMRRIKVDKTLRITYRVLDGGACVFHVGLHEAADRFANSHTAQTLFTTTSLTESIIMKPKPPTAPKSPAVATPAKQSGVQALADAISLLVSASIEESFSDGLNTLTELSQTQVEPVRTVLTDVTAQLGEQANRLSDLEAATAAHPAALAKMEMAASERSASERASVRQELGAVSADVSRLSTEVSAWQVSATGRLGRSEEALATCLDGQRELASSQTAVSADLAALGRRLDQFAASANSAMGELTNAVRGSADRAAADVAGLTAAIGEQAREQTHVVAAVAALGAELTAARTEAAAQCAALEERIGQKIDRVASEFAAALERRDAADHAPGRFGRGVRTAVKWIGARLGLRTVSAAVS